MTPRSCSPSLLAAMSVLVLCSCAHRAERPGAFAANAGETAPAATSAPAAGVLAGKLDCSGSQNMKQQVSWQAVEPGDAPGHELVQFVRIDTIASHNPDFDGAEQTVYAHLDQVRGTGSESGYNVSTLKNGDKVWTRFEGTHYFVPKSGSDWETPYFGSFRYVAGTGRYKAIRGGGYYRGVATPSGNSGQFVCEAEY